MNGSNAVQPAEPREGTTMQAEASFRSRHDAIVVGARIAGAATAMLLARHMAGEAEMLLALDARAEAASRTADARAVALYA